MTFKEMIKSYELTEQEALLLADTIQQGEWGDAKVMFLSDNGDVEEWAMGYCTNDAYLGEHFERRMLPNMFKQLYKKLTPCGIHGYDFSHFSDWWGDGTGDMLFIKTPENETSDSWSEQSLTWAKEIINNHKNA
jgi:hypothetical protein